MENEEVGTGLASPILEVVQCWGCDTLPPPTAACRVGMERVTS